MNRTNRTRRYILIGLVGLALTITQLPLHGQTRRAGPPPQTPPRPIQGPTINRDLPKLVSSHARGRTMGAAFKTGKLPEPLRKPQGTDDEVAVALAKKVSARDEQSLPALLAAVLNAGFGIREADGSVTQTIDPGQGLVFGAWEVAAMSKNYGEGKTTTLKYITDGFKSTPGFKAVPFEKFLLEGIRKQTQSDKQVLRFWSRFIVELGRNSDRPYDMLTENDPEKIRLDAVQAALILQRLSGDLYGLGKKQIAAAAARGLDLTRWNAQRKKAPQSNHATSRSLPSMSPCRELGRGDGSLILDNTANLTTSAYGELLDYIDSAAETGNSAISKFQKITAILNIVFAYAKFIAAYAALDTELGVENPPLIRTTDSAPGQRRRLNAKVTMDVDNMEWINCVRVALNVSLGIDASLISGGPLEGVEVNWHLVEGGAGDLYSNRGGVTGTHQIVGFWNGSKRIQDAGTSAATVGNPTRTITDKDGMASTFLEGSPQVPYIAEPRVPIMKRAIVMTTIKLKPGDVKGDATDLFGQLLGGVGGLITMPAELLYRTDWASTATLEVPVQDWEECDRGWHGRISITGQLTETTNELAGGAQGLNVSAERVVTKNFTYTFLLNGRRDTSDGSQNGYLAEAQIDVDHSNVLTKKKRVASGICVTDPGDGRKPPVSHTVNGIDAYVFSDLLKGNGPSSTTVYIAQKGAAEYNIAIAAPYPIPGKHIQDLAYKFPECPPWEKVRSHRDERDEPIFVATFEFTIPFDPKNPNVVKDRRTDHDARSRNGTITYEWDLTLCK